MVACISVPFWFKIIAGIFLLDMADYWFHRLDYKNPVLWRQHRVHHEQDQNYTDSNYGSLFKGKTE